MSEFGRSGWRLESSSPFASVRDISLGIIGTPAEVRSRGGVIPAWVIFGMIILGTFAICVAVNMRTRTRMSSGVSAICSFAN